MTTKLLPALAIALLGVIQLKAQPGSSATASVGADIVEAVGTGSTGNLISYRFYQPAVLEKNTFQAGGRRAGNSFWAPLLQQENSASFQITGAQYGFSISTTFESLIPHRSLPGEYIKIRSLQVKQETGADPAAPGNRYLLEATLEPGTRQATGHYQSLQPGRVTIHFN